MATKTGTKANPDMSTYYDNLQPTDQKDYRRKIEILDLSRPLPNFLKMASNSRWLPFYHIFGKKNDIWMLVFGPYYPKR